MDISKKDRDFVIDYLLYSIFDVYSPEVSEQSWKVGETMKEILRTYNASLDEGSKYCELSAPSRINAQIGSGEWEKLQDRFTVRENSEIANQIVDKLIGISQYFIGYAAGIVTRKLIYMRWKNL